MATHPLFRQEAVDHATRRLDGEVLLTAPVATWCAVAIIVAVLGLATCIATTATYTRTESARGWLTPEGGLARVFAGRDGFITGLMVSEGDLVEAGQPLVRIGTHWRTPNADHRPPPKSPSHAGVDLVRAPLGGRIEAVAVQIGRYVAHGDTVAVIAAGDDLVAEILLPSHVAGLVETGQRLRLSYDALDFGHRGTQEGIVTHVSRAPLASDDAGNDRIPLTEPVFPTRVRLPAQMLNVRGRDIPLRAGMLLTAEVAAHPQTLFDSMYQTVR